MKNNDEFFQNEFRIPSIRLKDWDYRSAACYFITICTIDKISYFGYIKKEVMNYNDLGRFADEGIKGINQQKQNVRVLNHVVMPNHVHALVLLKNNPDTIKIPNRFGPLLPGSLSSLVNHYKGMVTGFARKNSLTWGGWQERFYDHIIWDESSYLKIFDYISNNPRKWTLDKYYRKN